jgi:tRNA(adenine34) deaminase
MTIPPEAAPRVKRGPDETFMRMALDEARRAGDDGDVPVGAILVDASGTVIGRGRNRREVCQDPTAHAEVEAIRDAARTLGTWRLLDTTMYVTLEPCPMCAGALVNARVARVVYGCKDLKAGAVDTHFAIGRLVGLNHRFDVQADVLYEECVGLLRAFFAARRKSKGTADRISQDEPVAETNDTSSV